MYDQSDKRVIKYHHHGREVYVRNNLKGQHRDFCLCFQCDSFNPENRDMNCPIANALYKNCVEFGVVTPVWECPRFRGGPDAFYDGVEKAAQEGAEGFEPATA